MKYIFLLWLGGAMGFYFNSISSKHENYVYMSQGQKIWLSVIWFWLGGKMLYEAIRGKLKK